MRRLAAVGVILVLAAFGITGVTGLAAAGPAGASTAHPAAAGGVASAGGAASAGAARRPLAGAAARGPLASTLARRLLAVPPAPFLESVSPQGLGGLVTWNPDPVSAAVTQYSVEAIPAKGTTPPPQCSSPVVVTVAAANSATVVGPLCTGVAYVARVKAVNASGASAWSPSSNPFAPLPAQPPGAPLITSVLARDQSLVVSWSAPLSDGGQALSGYAVQAVAGGSTITVNAAASATSATVSGLTDGTSYQVSVVAQNSVGSSPAATSAGTPEPAYAPAAPGQFTAAPSGSGAVNLTWQPPADDGGAAISSYQVTYEEMVLNSSGQWVPAPGASPATVSAAGSATSLSVTGLSPANAFWSFSIAAVNAAGTGASASAGQPVAPQTATTSATVVLSSATMAALASDTGGVLTWPSPAPAQVSGLTLGQVIVAAPATAAPAGLLDTVQSITQTPGGGYAIGITPAPLSAAFSDLSLASAVNPLGTSAGGRGAQFHPSIPGIRMLPRRETGVTFGGDITIGVSIGEGPVSLSGELDFTPTLGIDIALRHNFVGVPDGATITATASLGIKASLQATLQGTLKKQIGVLVGDPQYYQVGPVPVIVIPTVPIFVTGTGSISTEISASVTIGGQATWDSAHPGTLSVRNVSTPLTTAGNPLRNVSLSGSIGFAEQPQEDLYDATGPDFETDENLTATVNPTPPAGGDYFTITPSISESIGWAVNLLGFNAKLNVDIAAQTFPVFHIPAPPSAFLTVTPANPSVPAGGTKQFTETRTGGGSYPVTWSVIGGAGDSISSTGLLQTVAPAGRNLTVVATDTSGAVGETNVTVGTSFSPPQNLQVTSALDGRSGTLTWKAPGSNGGSLIKSYTVVTDPQTATKTSTGTSATLTGLTPGTTYDVSVYATNASGLRSAPGSATFTPAVSCSITWTGTTSSAWSTASNWDKNRVPNTNDLACIDSGTVSITSPVSVYGLTISGGSLSTSSPLTATDLLTLTGGSTLAGPGTVTVASGATLSLAGILSGVDLVNDGQASIPASQSPQFTGLTTLENAGTLTIGDGGYLSWDGTAGGHIVNDAGGTISYPGGSSGGQLDPPVTNSGTVSAAAGTLRLTGALTQTGSGSFSGAGKIVLTSTVSPSGSGVTLSDVTVQGTLSGPGTLTVPAGRTVLLDSASLSGIDLVNRGTLTLAAGSSEQMVGATTLENAGALTIGDGGYLSWDGTSGGHIVNDAGGTISYPGGSSGGQLDPPVTNSGTISAAAGTLTLAGAFAQTSTGSFSGAGKIVLTSTVSPSGSGATLSDVTVQGGLSGPGTLTIPPGGTVVMTGSASLSGIDLVNQGSLTLAAGSAEQMLGATTLENAGALTIGDGGDLSWDGNSGGHIANDAGGTVSYAGGTSSAELDPPFDNHGTVSVTGGTLYLTAGNTGGGSDTGTYSTGTGGVINFAGGSRVLANSFAFSGPGQIQVSGGTVSVPGAVSVSGLTLTGGELAGPGTLTVPSGGVLTLGTSSTIGGGLTLVNDGTANVQAGLYASVQGGSTLENAGMMNLADGADISYGPDPGQLVNEGGGTISYAGGTQGATIDLPFDNYGTVSASVGVLGGTLYIEAGNTINASDTGTYNASSSAVIDFDSGNRVLSNAFTFNGPGQLQVSGGIVYVPGTASVSNLSVTGGELDGPGVLTVPLGGKLSLGAGASLGGRLTLVNDGTANVRTGNYVSVQGGSTLQNAGTMALADGADLAYNSDPGELVNETGATVSYPGGTLGASIDLPFDNHGTVSAAVGTRGGTLSISNGNTTSATDTGTYSASAKGTIAFAGGSRTLGPAGTLAGPGAIELTAGTVTDSATANGAALHLQGGTFEVTPQAAGKLASFVENAGGTLQFDVAGTTPQAEPAQLGITGAAALGGTFVLEPASGYVPATGTVLYLFDYASSSGHFATITYPPGNETYKLSAGATALTATATGTS